MPQADGRRVAIVHYWLLSMRGGERVVERLLNLYPQADLFTHVHVPEAMSAAFGRHQVTTTFINRLPWSRRFYQYYLPLMPMALEQLDLTAYDLVISSESGPAKGIIARPDATHVCYCHSPMRYLWDHYHQYRNQANPLARAAMPWLYHRLRTWDQSSSARVDRVAANSDFIRRRIARAWGRESIVIHPPVDVDLFTPTDQIEPFYLWVGQMVPYKRPDLAVDAFNALGLPLVMVGQGSMMKSLQARAKGNIRFIPRLSFDELRRHYAQARALVFTAEEDFGIVPVEAMASGRPVLAFGRGGVLDSIVPDRTGLFFAEQSPEAVIDAVERLERWMPDFDPAEARLQARRFAPEHFDRRFREFAAP